MALNEVARGKECQVNEKTKDQGSWKLPQCMDLTFKRSIRTLNICHQPSEKDHSAKVQSNSKGCVCVCICGSLNENALHRLTCFDTWSSFDRTVWEALGGVALLELCHWGLALRLQSPHQLSLSPTHLHLDQDISSQLLLQHPACLPAPNATDHDVPGRELRNCKCQISYSFL